MTEDHHRPSVTVVMLAYGDEPLLTDAAEAVLSSSGVNLDLVLVDNGCTSDAVARLDGRSRIRVVRPAENLGFAGGCNVGAREARGEFLGFVNSDAVVDRDALAHLVDAAMADDVGLVSGSVRLYERPELMNSAGNPVHYAGLSWAGGLGQPASLHGTPRDIASVSGAAMVVRRSRFERLGGFNELFFAYLEDAELSLRSWQAGWRCRYVPEARVLHHYEFARNPRKMFLLERNRLVMLLTLYQPRTLGVLAPALLVFEAAILAVALRQGWARQKAAGWLWLLRHRAEVRSRRATVQAPRLRSDAEMARLLTGDFYPGEGTGMAVPLLFRKLTAAYWSVARRLL
jgi:GT2 family glycosyltransferase